MRQLLIFLFAVMVLISTNAYTEVWYVKPDSTGEVINLQAGIDSCASGDTVLAAWGVYQGNGNRDLVVDEKAIVIISELGPDTTVIDCEGSSLSPHWAFDLQDIATEGCMISGFSITGCYGYGIRCDSSKAIFDNIEYYDNNSDTGGSALPILDCFHSSIDIANNYFTGNNGKAIECSFSNVQISDCLFSGHTTYGVYSLEFLEGSSVVMLNSHIIDNNDTYFGMDPIGGGGILANCSYFSMDSCIVSNNQTGEHGPACYFGGDTLIITDSQLINNVGGIGLAISFGSYNGYIQGSKILHNYGGVGAWSVVFYRNTSISNCIIANNSSPIFLEVFSEVSIKNSTIYNSVMWISEYATALEFVSSIIAFSDIYEGTYNFSEELCCNIYESIFSQIDSFSCNFSADPLFCDPENGIFTLHPSSPCLPGNHPNGYDCDLIGAYGLGCPDEEPYISTIEDVNNDQGRQVSIGWYRSKWDSAGSSQPITSYEVYRRIDELPIQNFEAAGGDPFGGMLYPPGDWHYLFDVPAHGEDVYFTVAPTLEDSCVYNDSTITGEPLYFSTYFIRASTSVPTVYFDSDPDSGYSVDNLAPGVPEGFTIVYNAGAGRQLTWEPCFDEDFQYYRIYNGESEDFIPSEQNLVHTCIETSWLDTDERGYWYHYYKISSVDCNGNESDAASPNTITGNELPPVPAAFALYQNSPNPFNPTTTIRFDLPRAVQMKLHVYNVKGELMSTLVDQRMTEGRKEVTWNAKDNRGRIVSSGIYFYRLVAGEFVQTKKMVLLR